jgi:hypothetical protein
MNKDITNFNSKRIIHGYQQWYWDKQCDKLWHRGKWVYGRPIGYYDYHSDNHSHTYLEASFYIR